MIYENPIVRISFGLVLLTVSLFLIAEVVGFAPDQKTAIVNSRKKMCSPRHCDVPAMDSYWHLSEIILLTGWMHQKDAQPRPMCYGFIC